MLRAGRPEKTRLTIVSSGAVGRIASAQALATPASGHLSNAVPTCTAEAPNSSAAATPRPSAEKTPDRIFCGGVTLGRRIGNPKIELKAAVSPRTHV